MKEKKDFVINRKTKKEMKMENDHKTEDQTIGLKPRVIKPLKAIGAVSAPSSKRSFRPSRSISSVKSVVPLRVAPLGILGKNKEEE